MSNHIRIIAVVLAVILHIAVIWLMPGRIRKIIIEVLRDFLSDSWENKIKALVVAAGISGLIFLTFAGTFLLSVNTLTNLMLNETRPYNISPLVIGLSAVFFLMFGIGFFSHHYETQVPKLSELEEAIIELAE